MTTRNELARAAFHGNNNLLMDYLYDVDGYIWDGIAWQGNGMTLARAIEIMESLSDEQMAELEAVGIIPVAVNVTESKIEELAAQVMSGAMLESFLAMPPADRLIGIATLAHIGGDTKVRDTCLKALKKNGAVTE